MLAPFFLDSGPGRVLCSLSRPDGPIAGRPGLVFLPPFAEEMNKSRHVLAQLAHRLAESGVATLLPDLHGTGDSHGDFGDADWTLWRGNVIDAGQWLLDAGCRPLLLGGLRLGATLALDVLPAMPQRPRSLILWQPVPTGRAALTQFLRLRAAGSLAAGGERETVGGLRERLAAGEAVEVAGYTLSPALYAAIEALDLAERPPVPDVDVDWLEVVSSAAGEPSAAARRLAAAWAERGVDVTPQAVAGDSFWATQELAEAPALVDASVARVRERTA